MKWDKFRGAVFSNKGGWRLGKGVVTHGYSLFDDIHGKASFFQVMILNVAGRLPQKKLADWLEAVWIGLSWPDPRIWCIKVGAYAGQARTSVCPAIAAGGLAGDSKIYGAGSCVSVVPFILKAYDEIVIDHVSIHDFVEKECKKGGRLLAPGFTRPLAKGDERVPAMQKYADRLGFKNGSYLELAYEIHDFLLENEGEQMNLAAYYVSFMLDQGYSSDEILRISGMSVIGSIYASYSEYRDKSPESFLTLRCDDIEYTGTQQRPVPAKE